MVQQTSWWSVARSTKAQSGWVPGTDETDRMGFAIYQAQAGLRHRDAKPLKGFGSGVVEVMARHDGDTFRAVYSPVRDRGLCPARLPEEGPGGGSPRRSRSSIWSGAG